MSRRNILVVAHARRDDTVAAAVRTIRALVAAGATPVMSADDRRDLADAMPDPAALDTVVLLGEQIPVTELDEAIVLGGDGTILRAAELVRGGSAPVLGVNMGHVGFLAESERDDMDEAVRRLLENDYTVEERLAVDVRVRDADGATVYETFALNEASIEKGNNERMLEVLIEVDGRPLTSYGCDGVVVSTPTGSTAYNFSAGGPVIWPTVQAIAVVPLSAHALFARPIVIDPASSVAIEMMRRSDARGVLWADGRRSFEMPIGARVTVRRSDTPVRLARLHRAVFTDRLVSKFRLPIDGWRGPDPMTGVVPVQRRES